MRPSGVDHDDRMRQGVEDSDGAALEGRIQRARTAPASRANRATCHAGRDSALLICSNFHHRETCLQNRHMACRRARGDGDIRLCYERIDRRTAMPNPPNSWKTVAIVVAAGRGSRAARDLPKQYVACRRQTDLAPHHRAFASHHDIDGILTVIGDGDATLYEAAVRGLPKLLPPVVGGATRQNRCGTAWRRLPPTPPQVVLVHDAARPFVSGAVIASVIGACDERHGAIPVLAGHRDGEADRGRRGRRHRPARGAGDGADAAGLSLRAAARRASRARPRPDATI